MRAEGSQAGCKQDIIEIEESDTAEEEDDDKWAKQEMSENTTMVAVKQIASLITSGITNTNLPNIRDVNTNGT